MFNTALGVLIPSTVPIGRLRTLTPTILELCECALDCELGGITLPSNNDELDTILVALRVPDVPESFIKQMNYSKFGTLVRMYKLQGNSDNSLNKVIRDRFRLFGIGTSQRLLVTLTIIYGTAVYMKIFNYFRVSVGYGLFQDGIRCMVLHPAM